MMKFTKQTDLCISGLNSYFGMETLIDDTATKAHVTYKIEVDFWSGGIREIGIAIQEIKASIDWSVEDAELTDAERLILKSKGGHLYNDLWEGIIELEESQVNTLGFSIDNECTFSETGSYQISEVSIDFRRKEITLT